MLWLVNPRWWVLSAALMMLAGIYGTYHGYRWADRSAQVKQLERTVAQANETIAALEEAARRANAAAAAYSQRESQAQEAAAELQEVIDALAEPSPDVCVLRDADVQRLRDTARRASGDRASPAGAAQHVRPAGPGASSR